MRWELKKVGQIEWQQDDSGCYTLIHYIKNNIVRIDFMNKDDVPVISFQGLADDVRKSIMQNWPLVLQPLSLEHASYIGAELIRCALLKDKYIQD